LHVPLFLKLPGNAHGGERKSKPVALVDVYPTLLELAGISSEGGHGTSLLRALEGHKETAERSLFSEGGHVEQYALTLGRWRLVEEFPGSESGEAALLTHPRVSDEWLRAHASELLTRPLTQALLSELSARPGFPAAVAELRRTLAGPYDSLYDVEADPAGQRDLAAEHPELVARLKPLLEREKARSRQARAEADPILARPARSAAERAALEALGYGGGSDDEPGTPPRTDPRPR
jgi:arylsulfatase A-like enzyme